MEQRGAESNLLKVCATLKVPRLGVYWNSVENLAKEVADELLVAGGEKLAHPDQQGAKSSMPLTITPKKGQAREGESKKAGITARPATPMSTTAPNQTLLIHG